MIIRYLIAFVFLCCQFAVARDNETTPFVEGAIFAELGNNLFQVATACALAWDHGAVAYFPGMVNRVDRPYNPQNVPLNYLHVFFRCNISSPPRPVSKQWNEPSFAYHPIPYEPNMRLWGYFQSEKYFAHHRDRLLELFAPSSEDFAYMKNKYHWLFDHPYTVAVMIREQYEDPLGKIYVQYGKDFIRKAMIYFPGEPLYIVSCNNLEFAKKAIPEEMKNVVFLEGEPHYIDLFLLSYCKHHMITNSTFAWWSAWLNQNPSQIVVTPKIWYNPSYPIDDRDRLPERWIKIDANGGMLSDPAAYQ